MAEHFSILSEDEVQSFLEDNPDWSLDGKALEREFKFPDFVAAVKFINAVAEHAEELNHHPEIYNVYNTVKIFGLCTHDAGNKITDLDTALASKISQLYK